MVAKQPANRDGETMKVTLVRLEGKFDQLSAEITGKLAEISAAVQFGDRQNAQQIEFVKNNLTRMERDLADFEHRMETEFRKRDDRIEANRRVALTSFIGPIVTAVIIAVILYVLNLK